MGRLVGTPVEIKTLRTQSNFRPNCMARGLFSRSLFDVSRPKFGSVSVRGPVPNRTRFEEVERLPPEVDAHRLPYWKGLPDRNVLVVVRELSQFRIRASRVANAI